MRGLFLSLVAILSLLSYRNHVRAQTAASSIFTTNLSIGLSAGQVTTLQQTLNRDPDTRIASVGPGSIGHETPYFGLLTRGAVVRFQEKYASEILVPTGLLRGNGYVGAYTRAKLNELSTLTASAGSVRSTVAPSVTVPSTVATLSPTDYVVKGDERINIYAGDKMIMDVRERILAVINSAITSRRTAPIVLPDILPTDIPKVLIKALSPQSGAPGIRVSITSTGISSNSAVYFGSEYIVRTVRKDIFGNSSFVIPPIPPARYDMAIQTDGDVSNTVDFVITDPRSPRVHIQSVSPATSTYGGTLTITGSGFSPQNNVVVTTFQRSTGVPSADGETLIVQLTPESIRESAKVGNGTTAIPMFLYVVNDYGFSGAEKSFTMTI